ncbi:hypothetical protein BU16DRAFT_615564 [Lophium mytilinum]|uniref:Uncharacterized protein n=1 Tax=Lophium mytilinum TaxID=390894 RepID=A0A6A6R2N1_9PEZI|nr:hypothetical protein BU16DRAFT_615564 [Lophium mytilinum]
MGRGGARQKDAEETAGIKCCFLQNLSFTGPANASKPYVSISILDPIITIERHHGKYHIAARFNLETSILNYENHTRDGHEAFFHSICLQYLSPWVNEELSMKPESDPSAALTVTRGTETGVSGTAGLSLSQMPSANVSLGLNRSKTLTVEYALATWSLSAHWITSPPPMRGFAPPARAKAFDEAGEKPVYQWFWAGTHGDTKTLTPDLKYTVKRHVVVKRAILVADFPSPEAKEGENEPKVTKSDEDSITNGDVAVRPAGDGVKSAKDKIKTVEGDDKELNTLESLLDFSFRVQVRVKKRFGRFHRVVILSGNEVKGKLINPLYDQVFRLRGEPSWEGVPESDTDDINSLLGQIKQDYAGNYDDLDDKDFFELSNAYMVKQRRTVVHGRDELRERDAPREKAIMRPAPIRPTHERTQPTWETTRSG